MTDPNLPNWRTLKASVRGAAHHRTGLPNQDAVRVARANGGLPLIVALADGHGSAKSFRSQHGARSAVTVALKVYGSLFESDSLSQIKRWAEEQLPLELVRHWRERGIGRWPAGRSSRRNWNPSTPPAAAKWKPILISPTAPPCWR
jgi:hypothetical protein